MIALQRIQNQTLVRLGDLRLRKTLLVRQIHLCRDSPRIQPGRLGVQFQVNCFRGLNTND